MITFVQKGDFYKTTKFLNKAKRLNYINILEKYAKEGVAILSSSTPVDSGITAASWYYEIEHNDKQSSIIFYNSNINKGVHIAIILQYGHGTGTGGWVQGRDYINPAVQPLFDKITEDVWKEVTK